MTRFLWQGFFCLLLSSVGISNAIAQKSQEPRLLDHAVKIADVKAWDEHWRFSLGHHWLTEHTVLYSRSGSDSSRLMDVKTGKSRQLPQLFISGHLTGIYPSPDGKWIFMRDYHDYDYTLTTFDGSQTYSLSGYSGEILWLADSRHFINYNRTDRTSDKRLPDAIGNVNHPNRLTQMPDSSSRALEDCELTDAGDHFVTLTWHDPPKAGNSVWVRESGLGLRPFATRKYKFPIPAYGEMMYLLLSPKGNRLLWVFESKEPPAQQQPYTRQASFTAAPEVRVFRLYVSGSNGKHMRALGVLKTQTGDLPEDRWREEFQVNWLPGGTKIDFEYRNTLYTVAIH